MKKIYAWLAVLLLIVSTTFVKGDNPMPRGFPDGDVSNYSYASRVSDVSSIYQMLWGFSPIDGQGRVWYLDTFNNGLSGFSLAASGSGVNPVVTQDQGKVYSPPAAIKLSPGVTAGSFSWIFRDYYLGVNSRLAMEAGFVFSNTTPNWRFQFDYRYKGNPYIAVLQFDHATGFWKIALNFGSGTYQNIFLMDMTAPNSRFMQVKLVADWNTGKYVRALIGENLIDLSSYNLSPSNNTIEGYISTAFRAESYGAGTTDGYLGYVLLTKDEP